VVNQRSAGGRRNCKTLGHQVRVNAATLHHSGQGLPTGSGVRRSNKEIGGLLKAGQGVAEGRCALAPRNALHEAAIGTGVKVNRAGVIDLIHAFAPITNHLIWNTIAIDVTRCSDRSAKQLGVLTTFIKVNLSASGARINIGFAAL